MSFDKFTKEFKDTNVLFSVVSLKIIINGLGRQKIKTAILFFYIYKKKVKFSIVILVPMFGLVKVNK